MHPRELADETLDRTARRLNEGTEIVNLVGFVTGVARNVLLESFDNAKREARKLADMAEIEHAAVPSDEDVRVPCFRDCLDALPAEESRLLVDYYDVPDGPKIERRKELAKTTGETANALRIRVYRIRRRLDECIRGCLEDAGLK